MAAPNWRENAVCQVEHVDPGVFIPSLDEEADGELTRLRHEIAKAYCRRCPVAVECLEYALLHFERVGVWGNTTPRERRTMWTARRRPDDVPIPDHIRPRREEHDVLAPN